MNPLEKKSNGGHWYTEDGKPMHEVPNAKGIMRPTTLADARKLNLFCSVTTILKDVLAKPGLEVYKQKEAAFAVLREPMLPDESMPDFVNRILIEQEEHAKDAAEAAAKGTDIHKMLERHLFNPKEDQHLRGPMIPIIKVLRELPLIKGLKPIATELVVVGEGYAGTTDLQIGESDKFIDLIDYKSTRSVPREEPWTEHKLQVAAYCAAIVRNSKLMSTAGLKSIINFKKKLRAHVIYLDTNNPGIVAAFEVEGWEKVYSKGFKPLLQYWQWRKDYRPKQKRIKK